MKTHFTLILAALVLAPQTALFGTEYHVATTGNDANRGTRSAPFRSIQRAADAAQPGDTITVHQGIYRERVNPPRGGTSDKKRIVYQAAKGEKVEIRGSEIVDTWDKVQEGVWKVTLPNTFFGKFNPYKDLIHGDWFDPKGRQHHTGAVYLNGDWLVEATKLEEVLAPAGQVPAWWQSGGRDPFLLNLAWFRPVGGTIPKVPASKFAAQQGIQTAPAAEGDCIGWIEDGDWVRYEGVDFGVESRQMEFWVASATDGGIIEIHLDSPAGLLLGSCAVAGTGGWQSWASCTAPITPTARVQTICLVFRAHKNPTGTRSTPGLWFAQVDEANTTIWAQFPVDPNQRQVEINVRKAVFFPDQPGRNFVTVRGFAMRQAATPWPPPTAGQVGLIGTHWSKGWIIENNTITHSTCSGIALGKYSDQWDNTSADTAEGYVKTIERAHQNGWTRDNIGHHVVRNNTIAYCEQAGIVGSLGAAFSTVTGNTIHDIHIRRLFTGAEMAGIKFHAAIDTTIANNHIYRTCLGLWLDWMAQGTRVSANLFEQNDRDLFVEVNHGPFLVDNNLFLSTGNNLLDMSEGGAYAHNLFAGTLHSSYEPNRQTPFHPAHSTAVAGLRSIKGGDCRFYNNIFVGRGESTPGTGSARFGLAGYSKREVPQFTGGNVYYNGAQMYDREAGAVVTPADPQLKLVRDGTGIVLEFTAGPELKEAKTRLVTTALLGQALVPGLPYENADGSPLRVDRDFLGNKRDSSRPAPGPFEKIHAGQVRVVISRAP